MCGRYSLSAPTDVLVREFDLCDEPELAPSFNIAPGRDVAVVANRGRRHIELFRWGLVPRWAADPSIGHRLVNARAESAAEKPSFREALRERRCLIPADGFYEWKGARAPKTPMYARLRSGAPFAFAGLWERWRAPDAPPLYSCVILTTAANALLAPVHDRMPVILPRTAYAEWLDPRPRPATELAALLAPFPADLMEVYEVSTLVNKPENDGPQCIEPV